MKVLEFLQKHTKHFPDLLSGEKINYKMIPTTVISMEEFNEVAAWLEDNGYDLHSLKRTPSGGIKKDKYIGLYGIDLTQGKTGFELVIFKPLEGANICCRLQFRNLKTVGCDGASEEDKEKIGEIATYQLFNTFKHICEKFNVDLEKYALKTDEEIKYWCRKCTELECKPLIGLTPIAEFMTGIEYENCHSVDISSAYPYWWTDLIPELREPVQYIYEQKQKSKGKDKLFWKSLLVRVNGFFYCNQINYRFAHIYYHAVSNTRKMMLAMSDAIKSIGRSPLLYRTDSIKFCGAPLNDAELEQLGILKKGQLGKFILEEENIKLIWRSAGAYYITRQDGSHKVVQSGRSKLDLVLPRSEWTVENFMSKAAIGIIGYTLENNRIIEVGGEDYE